VQKAISGSIIQNSLRCFWVWLFSALKVGPNVYTSLKPTHYFSTSSCPLHVSIVFCAKKSCFQSTIPGCLATVLMSFTLSVIIDVTWNNSPAPSPSDVVIIGVWIYKNPFELKNSCVANASEFLTLATAPMMLDLTLRCGIVRSVSMVTLPLPSGYFSSDPPSTVTAVACNSTSCPLAGDSLSNPSTANEDPASAFLLSLKPGTALSTIICKLLTHDPSFSSRN